MKKELNELGFFKINNLISKSWIELINKEIETLFIKHEKIRRKNNNPIKSNGLAMNALIGSDVLLNFLIHLNEIKLIDEIEDNFFHEHCILNSFSALSNIPNEEGVFHKKIHRDVRGFSSDIPLMLNMLVMLDDFTIENGATLLLPGSHLQKQQPSKEFFEENAISATGNAGDVLVWNSNLFHASGINRTSKERRALPITFSLPYYKQLIDYPSALDSDVIFKLDNKIKKLLGFDSIVSKNLNEWYSPIDRITYKKD